MYVGVARSSYRQHSCDDVTKMGLCDRDGKSYKRYKRCWCKEFPTGVKILVESVIKGGVNFFYFVANHALLV